MVTHPLNHPGDTVHRLANIDPEQRVADCEECGPGVRIRPRENGRWRCRQPGVKRHARETKNRQKRRARVRAYGLTLDEYEAMVARYGNVCAICGRPPGEKRLAIDHCHRTGRVRGLLCRPCNLGLGYFQDNPEVMRAAIAYLAADD